MGGRHLWMWALEALHVYVQAAVDRTGLVSAEICGQLPTRHEVELTSRLRQRSQRAGVRATCAPGADWPEPLRDVGGVEAEDLAPLDVGDALLGDESSDVAGCTPRYSATLVMSSRSGL